MMPGVLSFVSVICFITFFYVLFLPDNQMFQYFITIVPTKLQTYKLTADMHQYSVTERVGSRR